MESCFKVFLISGGFWSSKKFLILQGFQAQCHRETLQGTKGNLPQTYIKPCITFSAKLIPSELYLLPGISISVLEEFTYSVLGGEEDGEAK